MMLKMILMNLVVLILKNLKEGTFHPIYYLASPLPGGGDALNRWKSKGHHTVGFATAPEAIEAATGICEKLSEQDVAGELYYLIDEGNFEFWDGEGVPASVAFFDVSKFNKFIKQSS